MVDIIPLEAELRDGVGKGAARAVRNIGRVPGIIYGNKEDPIPITLDAIQIRKELDSGTFFTKIYRINAGKTSADVLPRDVQLHPVSDIPMHVDFMRFSSKTKFDVEVQVVFKNEDMSPGLKRGGVLNVVRYTIELRCSPDRIPENVVINLDGLDIGDGVHISAVELPEGVEPTISDRDFTIATIASPTVVKDEVEDDGTVSDEDTTEATSDADASSSSGGDDKGSDKTD